MHYPKHPVTPHMIVDLFVFVLPISPLRIISCNSFILVWMYLVNLLHRCHSRNFYCFSRYLSSLNQCIYQISTVRHVSKDEDDARGD